jgi:hypothetical protein
MKIERIPYDPSAVLNFYEEGLGAMGALCERTWHDRLEVVAEGRGASLWNADGSIESMELHFAPADAATARDANREVFPGCPLTFRLAEALRPAAMPLERLILANNSTDRSPDPAVAEKLWRAQFPETTRWRLKTPFKSDFHFSALALARCEIQAIDQHWSLNRVAVALPGGEPDENLARDIAFAKVDPAPSAEIPWPKLELALWHGFIDRALELDLKDDLRGIVARQENSLKRELSRVDDYFENYARELAGRAGRSTNANVRLKQADRLAAAKAEHERRRADQIARHEIRVHPHLDALLLIAEPAWRAELELQREHRAQSTAALLIPRSRRWEVLP